MKYLLRGFSKGGLFSYYVFPKKEIVLDKSIDCQLIQIVNKYDKILTKNSIMMNFNN